MQLGHLYPYLVAATATLAVTGGGLSMQHLQSVLKSTGHPAGLDAHETHASASLLGQFRTSVSSWLWLRTDLYLHNGVELRRLTDAELKHGAHGVGSSDNHDRSLHDDDLIVTVIPSKSKDFRGVFGDLERATATYKNMIGHEHNDPKTALPLFRLMTWIDPQFIPGWTTGAAIISRDHSRIAIESAITMLYNGLQQNPESIEILSDLGAIQCSKNRQFSIALEVLNRACTIGESKRLTDLSEHEVEGLINAFRWLALCYREVANARAQLDACKRGLRIFPGDGVLQRLSQLK